MASPSSLSKTMGLKIGAEVAVRRVLAVGCLPEGCLSRRMSLVDRGMASPSVEVQGTISSSFSTPPLVFRERYLRALWTLPFIIKSPTECSCARLTLRMRISSNTMIRQLAMPVHILCMHACNTLIAFCSCICEWLLAVVLAVLRVHVAVPELVFTDNGLPTSLRGVLLKPPGWVVGFLGCFSPPFGT